MEEEEVVAERTGAGAGCTGINGPRLLAVGDSALMEGRGSGASADGAGAVNSGVTGGKSASSVAGDGRAQPFASLHDAMLTRISSAVLKTLTSARRAS